MRRKDQDAQPGQSQSPKKRREIIEIQKGTMAIMHIAEAVNEVSDSIKSITDQVTENLTASRRAIEAIEVRVNDPQYDAILRNISEATAYANETLFHGERKTKELTRPKSWFWWGVRLSWQAES